MIQYGDAHILHSFGDQKKVWRPLVEKHFSLPCGSKRSEKTQIYHFGPLIKNLWVVMGKYTSFVNFTGSLVPFHELPIKNLMVFFPISNYFCCDFERRTNKVSMFEISRRNFCQPTKVREPGSRPSEVGLGHFARAGELLPPHLQHQRTRISGQDRLHCCHGVIVHSAMIFHPF